MKVLFSSHKNTHFLTLTEYIEKALKSQCDVLFFENRRYKMPGRLREKIKIVQQWDIRKINSDLLNAIDKYKPDIFLEAGGDRILTDTIEKIKKKDIICALWTIDPLQSLNPFIAQTASAYDFVFTGGSEAYNVLDKGGIKKLYFMPFACDPEFHKPVFLTEEERKRYRADIVFVGTVDPNLYPQRVKVLEAISDMNLAVWGPGVDKLTASSLLIKNVKGKEVGIDYWRKIYAASNIVVCSHFKPSDETVPCYQASPRVYEVLACGKLLIVDAQPDVLRLFKNKKELVVYNDVSELRKLIKYYLANPLEREAIALAGQKEVIKKHTYIHRVKEILTTLKK